MNKFIIIAAALAGCGLSAKSNELVGQAKKVVEHTPLVCGDYTTVDVSLGVMRDGNGSMSREDVVLVVQREADRRLLKAAAESGAPIKVTYDVRRLAWCTPDHELTSVSILTAEQAK